MKSKVKMGKVFLVGAGPGDPGLITVKGLKCIKKAEVIIYDYLVSKEILNYANPLGKLIYVGKRGGDHSSSQEEINNLLVKNASLYNIVVRLKGGDPFVFGRGGEEIETLFKFGIDFEIVPGITSAVAVPAYAGIPLSHRHHASEITFVTGHEDPLKNKSNIDWLALGRLKGTLVFFMGIKNFKNIVDKLVLNAKDVDTPVAVIRWGTLSKQVTVVGTLGTIIEKCANVGIKPPAIIVVGTVVALREKMRWFDKFPLIGKSIIITRARAQVSELAKRLSSLGANCVECPVIKIVPEENRKNLKKAIDNISEYEWMIFTSVNSVKIFFDYVFELGRDVRLLNSIKIAVIGPATAKELLRLGLNVDIVPDNYCAESIIEAFKSYNLNGKKICLPRAREARNILPHELSKMGALIDVIPIYKTVKSSINVEKIIKNFENGKIDMVTFTSSSTVKNFKNIFLDKNSYSLPSKVNIAAIGPITAATASDLGFKIDVVASNYTIEGLCDSIVAYYS